VSKINNSHNKIKILLFNELIGIEKSRTSYSWIQIERTSVNEHVALSYNTADNTTIAEHSRLFSLDWDRRVSVQM